MPSHPFALCLFLLFVVFSEGRSTPVSRPAKVLDPTNASGHGILINSTRLVLKMECTDCPVFDMGINKTWKGNDAALIYDLSIIDRAMGTIAWTNPDPKDPDHRISFYPPADFGSLSPFGRGINMVARPSITVSEYLDGSVPSAEPLRIPGVAMDVGIANTHRWNITRVSYVNGLAYTGPGQEISNVSVALIYLFQNGTQPVELVWWEIQNIHDYHSDMSDPQLPIGLGRKILGLEQVEDEQEVEGGDEDGDEQVDQLPWAPLAFIAVAVAATCVLVARTMKNRLCDEEGGDYELLDKERCDSGQRSRAWF